jgi:hypothetical protein
MTWGYAWIVAVALAVFLVGGCAFYNHAFPVSPPARPGYDLHVVQVDDFGSFWEADKAREAIAAVEAQSLSLTSNTFVVVFIHGWHHNAAPDDDNLTQFSAWLDQLSKQLAQPARRGARAELTGSADFKLIGIYIGWRGRSLPGFLDYATMWWRKSAAERVGDGDVSEFLERLQRIYLRANAYERYRQNPGHTPLTGLVTVGHSFGGQVLLKAVSHALEAELVMRAPRMTDTASPPGSSGDRTPERVAIDSFGDLNVLLNPATEAYQFARIDVLYRQLKYPFVQTPQLVVFSADNDVPRRFFFPIARGITRPFRPSFRDSYQGALWGRALGEFAEQQTHELRLAQSEANSLSDGDFEGDGRLKIAKYDFTSATVFAGIKLTRLEKAAVIENSPVAVVYTHDGIIDGHNGIFQPPFLEFLTGYIAFIEAKRAMLRYQQFEERRVFEERRAPRQ